MVIDVVQPRIFTTPPASESLGAEAVAFAQRVGLTLDHEQELVLEASLGVREDGRWQSFEVGVNMPRQNGKGEILMARELFGLFELGEPFIVHSAHEFKTSEKHFQRLEGAIRGCPELYARVARADSGRVIGFRYSHGDEAIELSSGERIEFRTRTKGGMRGFDDVALLVIDEAMIYSLAAQGAMMPTLRASKAKRGPQLWFAGSPVDQTIHEHGIVWARVRERGIADKDPSLTYIEWSLDFDSPDEVPEDVAADPAEWRKVNFAIERGRVLEEHMEREHRSLPTRSFAVELLGVGDWPPTDEASETVIPLDDWYALADENSKIESEVAFAIDVSPDRRWAAISAAGPAADGKPHVEVVERGRGTGWIVASSLALVAKHKPVSFICDGKSPAASLVPDLVKAGIEVTEASLDDVTEACGMLFDAVDQEAMHHLGQDELASALKAAKKRDVGERWAWSRRNSSANITPLVSATLALWGARTIVPEAPPMVAYR